MNKRWNKLCVSALACMALVVPLTACEGQLPTPAADTSTKVAPDLTEAQEKKIRLKILKTIDEADQAKNPDGYATVMGGPQLDIRISQTTINQRGGGMSEYATIPKDIAQTVIPTDDGWPRSVFTITTTTEDQQSKRLLVFDQESAQQNYKLMAMARLFEGAKLPKFEIPTIGSQMGTAKDEKLPLPPMPWPNTPMCCRTAPRANTLPSSQTICCARNWPIPRPRCRKVCNATTVRRSKNSPLCLNRCG